MGDVKGDFPYLDTQAARMLASGIQRASVRDGISLRQLGKRLGYKQAVVLSHMASGRVPIPIDRAQDLATTLEVDPKMFLAAVLDQRHPDVDWALITGMHDTAGSTFHLAADLTGGRAVDELTPGQRAVMREVAADPQASRRWLSVHEVEAVEMLRELRPTMVREGLGPGDRRALRDALTRK
ncbi:MAG: XRE family transcriptional regulator [Sphingomonadales bacterium]|nr:MAG: XRE family transcriptional regulator [Sphingomonadales bacterium]